jgi:uncharacterized protein
MKTAVFLLVATAATGAEFDSHARETVMVRMRDGVRLATDVYRPAVGGRAVEGRFPMLVTRTPYNKDGERSKGEFFARHGYVFVAQDCRSFFGSEGIFDPMSGEGRDGYDTIEWAAAQPWSNGRVGTTGASYLALVQYAALVERPPHLQAIYAAVGPVDYFHAAAWRGGVPGLGWPVWIANSAAARTRDVERKRVFDEILRDPAEWLRNPPSERASLLDAIPEHRAAYEAFYRHSTFDEYWRDPGRAPEQHLERMKNVPALLLSGWYDANAEATLRLFSKLAAKGEASVHAVLGPWPHAYGKRECGDAVFPEDAALDERALQLQWFGRWLKDESSAKLPAIRYFVMGGGPGYTDGRMLPGGSWKETTTWPPPNAQPLAFPLNGDRTLANKRPSSAATVSYEFDPANPAPVAGGRYRNGCIVDVDKSPLRERNDVVRFATEPLQASLKIVGSVQVELNVRTSARDADFIARLIDVWPDGYAMPVVEGQVRLSRRARGSARERIQPGKTYRATLNLGTTALLVPAGHKLRLDITSSAFPMLEPNAGTGEDEWKTAGAVKARQTIVTGGSQPSRLLLPVVTR